MLKKRKVLTVLERIDEHLEYHRAIDKHKSQVAFFEVVFNHTKQLEDLIVDIEADLKLRADTDLEDGGLVMNISASIWSRIKEFNKGTSK